MKKRKIFSNLGDYITFLVTRVCKDLGCARFPEFYFNSCAQGRTETVRRVWWMVQVGLIMFLINLWWTHVLFVRPLIPQFGFLVMSPLGFKARVGSIIHTWQRQTMIYIPWDSPLVRHLPTSWWSAWQLGCARFHEFCALSRMPRLMLP